jgi:minor histocompatibility antigen H13
VLLTDILSLSFSHTALSFLKIDSFKTGCVFLSGLFVYDIWWVFGTDVVSIWTRLTNMLANILSKMVSVADSLDLPIKLLWPKSIIFSHEQGFTTLGLGDVVVPGTFIALALRYDYYRFSTASGEKRFVKPYFYSTLVGYVAGLVSTMIALNVFGSSQPALLYLR